MCESVIISSTTNYNVFLLYYECEYEHEQRLLGDETTGEGDYYDDYYYYSYPSSAAAS